MKMPVNGKIRSKNGQVFARSSRGNEAHNQFVKIRAILVKSLASFAFFPARAKKT
jgi:hypothetical protein